MKRKNYLPKNTRSAKRARLMINGGIFVGLMITFSKPIFDAIFSGKNNTKVEEKSTIE